MDLPGIAILAAVWMGVESTRAGWEEGEVFLSFLVYLPLRCVGLLLWPATEQCDGTQRFLGAGGCMVVPDPLLGRRCGGLLATRMRAAAPSAFTSTADSIP
jgi:hypothetical protein